MSDKQLSMCPVCKIETWIGWDDDGDEIVCNVCDTIFEDCDECDGKGVVTAYAWTDDTETDWIELVDPATCSDCNGLGMLPYINQKDKQS